MTNDQIINLLRLLQLITISVMLGVTIQYLLSISDIKKRLCFHKFDYPNVGRTDGNVIEKAKICKKCGLCRWYK